MTKEYYMQIARSSPQDAHKALADEYLNYVYTIVYNKLRSTAVREDIEECVSDVFADVFSVLEEKSKLGGDLKGFIGTVAKRRAIDYYRRAKNKIDTVSIEDERIGNLRNKIDVEKEIIDGELCKIIYDQVKTLGEPDSSIIIYKYYYNKSSSEIGDILSMKPSAVRMRCSRALKRLKEKLADIVRE